MVVNEIYTGAGSSVTMIPERDFKISENFGTTKGSKELLATTASQTTLTWSTAGDVLVPNIYRGCMAKLDRYDANGATQNHSQTLMIESNTSTTLVFSQALDSTGSFWYECTILAFGTPMYAEPATSNKHNLLADNWLGLVTTFTPPSVDAEMKQLNLALGGTRNFGYQFKGAETVGEASIDVSLNNGSWLYYALGKKTYSHTPGGSNTLNASLQNGSSYGVTSSGSDIYRVEDGEILPPFTATDDSATKVTSITVSNDGVGIPFAASQALSFSGGGGTGAAATYTLTKNKHTIDCTTESGTNYDGKWIKIEAAAASTVKYVFWFDIDNAGASVPGHGVSGSTDVEVTTISSDDAAGTVATELATIINAQTGLTATADGAQITVESTSGGKLGAITQAGSPPLTVAQLVVGGEIESVTISNSGSGYSSAPTIANVTGDTAATFTAVLGSSAKADYKEITAAVTYDIAEDNSGNLPSFSLEVSNEKGSIADGDYFVDADKQKVMARIFTGCQVNSLTLNFEEGQEVTSSISAISKKAHDAETNYVPRRKIRTTTGLQNYSSTVEDNNPYMYSDGTIKIYGQTMARIKSGSVTISNNITPHRYIGNYDRTMASAHTAAQRTYEISLNLLITDQAIWDELRNQNETDSSVGLIEIEFAKSATDKITLKFDNYLTTSVDIPFPDDKGALEVALTAQARTLNSCTYQGKWIILG
tara:strand:- start:5928 stop:8054 length:2127 start_codon:yes stop_codon:yes gene_type:complete